MFFGEYDYDMDIKVQRGEAYEDGLVEGESRGAKQTARENAKNALAMGLSPEQAAQITSLPFEEVLALKEQLAHEPAPDTTRV